MNRITALIAVLVLAAMAEGSTARQSTLTTSNQTLVNKYVEALKSAENGGSSGKIEAAYVALTAVRDALTRRQNRNGDTPLSSLSDVEFERTVNQLRGAIVNRDEIIVIAPDPKFFASLADSHGDAGDRAYFKALRQTYPVSIWPAYVEDQTDVTGCTVFGEGKLIVAYRTWSEFRRLYPKRYVAAAGKEVQNVVWRFTEENCACADAASMQREFEQFLSSFPNSPIHAKVKNRQATVSGKRYDAQRGCIHG